MPESSFFSPKRLRRSFPRRNGEEIIMRNYQVKCVTLMFSALLMLASALDANAQTAHVSGASASFGTVAIGHTSPAIPVTFTFDTAGTVVNPVALTMGAPGLDFAVASGSTCKTGTYSEGDSCTVNVTLTPKFAGLRNGAVLLKDGAGNPIATAYIHGTGSGPQVNFLPGTVSNLSFSNLAKPKGVAVDGAGNLYVTDAVSVNSPSNVVVKETWTGSGYTQSTIVTGLAYPVAVAVDGAGNVYIADEVGQQVLKETPSSGGYTQSIVADGVNILSNPLSVAVDGSGNVYMGSYNNVVGLLKATLTAAGYTLSTIAADVCANSIAVDGAGNIYLDQQNSVVKLTPSKAGYIQSQILGDGGDGDYVGAAVDAIGNLYITLYGGGIVKVTFSGGGKTQTTIPSNLRGFLAVDGSGNIFVANSKGNNVSKVDVADAPFLPFDETTVGQTSATQDVTVQNFGNAPLIFQPFVADNLLDAMLASTGSTDCTELSNLQLASGAACTLGIGFEPAHSGPIQGHVNIVDNALNAASPNYATQSIAVQGTGILPAPVVSLSATTLAFGNVPVNTESVYQPVTLTNTGGSPLTISSVALMGTNETQFLISSNYCPASLAVGANCTIHLHFYPNVTGAATGALTVTDNAADSPQSVTLTGTATTPAAVSLSATSLVFGNVPVNTESVYQPVTLTNTGGSPLTISGIVLTGTNKAQFLISSNYCPASLAAGANCVIHLHFYPQITGAATAALTIADAASGSPQSVSLTGTGTTPAVVSLSATSLAFGNVTVQTESVYQAVAVTNTGGSPLTISGVVLTGTNKTQFLISSNDCPTSLAAGANCVIHLHFFPNATGAATAALTITDNATGSPQSVTLTGTGLAPAMVSLSTTSIDFGNVAVKTESVFQPVTLTNTGGSPLTISSVALTGAQFLISSNYCPANLAAGANCIIHLHFCPQVTGAATAALTITDNATGSPQSVTLTGTGK
jgi:hypothetical protein